MPLSDSIQFSTSLKGVILSRQSGDRGIEMNGNRPGLPGGNGVPAQDPAAFCEQLSEAAYQRGLEEGKALQEAEMRGPISAMEQELNSILSSVTGEREAFSRSFRDLLPELVVEGVGRILYGFQPDRETVRRIVEEILEGVDADDDQIRLTLNPEDLEILMGLEQDFGQTHPGLRLIADEKLYRGECRLDSRFGVADARHSAKLANLRKVLE